MSRGCLQVRDFSLTASLPAVGNGPAAKNLVG